MDVKKLASLKRRIKKDRTTFSVGGAMTLTYEFDAMAIEDLLTLRESLDFQYRILNEAIERRPNITLLFK